MSDFLQQMAQSSHARAVNASVFRASDFDKPLLPLSLQRFDVIAEIKDRSPAEGNLATQDRKRSDQAKRYESGGAAAISVLTEPTQFKGALSHLEEVVAAVSHTPVMRKDFLVEPVQVLEARAAGASGVLLIVAMLSDAKLRAMLDTAHEHDMFVLLESFGSADLARTVNLLDAIDLDRAAQGQLLFGVNTRNLRTLHVDPDRLQRLATELPQGPCVAESGLYSADDAARVASWGYSVALVGTALMKCPDPAVLIKAMRDAGSASLAA